MSEAKDTIYIDIDDEITSIIEKVGASKHKIVALVLPKRATVLQSIVNMKLLKRRADNEGKRVVLITSEKNLLPIAGAVGMYTAKTLQSKPTVPPPPEISDETEDLNDSYKSEESDLDSSKSIGELAGMAAVAASTDKVETINIEDEEPEGESENSDKPVKKDKKIKIPNFDSFRTRLFLIAGGGVLLLILLFVATRVLPKALITVKADTSTVDVSSTFTADTTLTEVNTETGVSPAELKPYPKTDSMQVTTTGQKDNGTKASGTVTLSIPCASVSGSPPTLPAGSGVSSQGVTFITQNAVSLTTPSFAPCKFSGTANVVAQQNGDKYNLVAGQTFTVAGYSSVTGTNSSAMTGGTSKIVKVVAQADIDDAKQKLIDKNKDEARAKLIDDFQLGNAQGIVETFSSGAPKVTNSPEVGKEADNVTVNAEIIYTMLGVKKDDLKKFIEADVGKKVDTSKQPIQDYGLDQLTFQLLESKSPNQAKVTMYTVATVGVKLNTDELKKQVAGKKKGDVEAIIGSQTGVKEVIVDYSPFWVSKTPKNTDKITIVVEQTNTNGQP